MKRKRLPDSDKKAAHANKVIRPVILCFSQVMYDALTKESQALKNGMLLGIYGVDEDFDILSTTKIQRPSRRRLVRVFIEKTDACTEIHMQYSM